MLGKLLISLGPVALILLVSEVLWRTRIAKGERARKFIHILAGSWMAFWPYYISFDAITILSIFALIVLVYSRITKLFHGIYAVRRRTYGELFFASALLFCSLLAKEPWIFTVSILFLALADGVAAVVGRFWGITNQYLVFGSRALLKSRAGTLAYLAMAYAILVLAWFIGGKDSISNNLFIVYLVLPLSATLLENIGPYGTDNLITPVYVTLLLNAII